jgi:hypothetical protein
MVETEGKHFDELETRGAKSRLILSENRGGGGGTRHNLLYYTAPLKLLDNGLGHDAVY